MQSHRHRRLARQVRVARERPRRRQGAQLQVAHLLQGVEGARLPRRLLRQRRRRHPRLCADAPEPRRAHRAVRRDLAVQRREACGAHRVPQPHLTARVYHGLRRVRLCRAVPRGDCGHWGRRRGREHQAQVPHRRRACTGARSAENAVHRWEHRQAVRALFFSMSCAGFANDAV